MNSDLGVKQKKNISAILLNLILIIICFGVMLLFIGYINFSAKDRYISTAEFSISENQSSTIDAGLLAIALPGLVDSVSQDSQLTTSFISSADLLIDLETKFGLIEHYSAPEGDFYFSLPKDANIEERLAYYRTRITSHFNQETGLTVISVESFDPEFSKLVADELLKRAEEFVNSVNQQIADRQFQFLHQEFERAAKNLDDANAELTELQNRYKFISPEQMISSTVSAIDGMNASRLEIKAEIATLMRDSPNSPRISVLESELRSLEDLISIEKSKLSGAEKDRLKKISQEFSYVKNKINFRTQLLSGAQVLIEKNRSEAISNSKFFTVIQTPFIPEDAALPKRLYTSLTIFAIGTLVFIIMRILLQSVIERV